MKTQIRQGVFETNSSSTHAISIAEFNDAAKKNIPEFIKFRHDEGFGWENHVYNDTMSKAMYLWIAVLSQYSKPEDEDKVIEIKSQLTEILKNAGVQEVAFQEANYKTSTWDKTYTYLDIAGYIDHTEDLRGWIDELLDEPDLLLGWLFNENSQVHTGNDNSDESPGFNSKAIWTMWKGN